MQTKSLIRKWLVLIVVVLFVGTSITSLAETSDTTFTKTKATIGLHDCSRDQVELRYYDPNALTNVVGVTAGAVWKSAIRLTHTELAPYKTWNLTQVVIGFGEDPYGGPMNVTIYIYGKGTATNPGDVIVNDTWAILSGDGLITVPLKTPVSLSSAGLEEIWVAVEWTEIVTSHYAYIDDGPAVDGKGDWIFLNNIWYETQHQFLDNNWALGAIVEGSGLTTLGITNIKGPVGVKADIQNMGDVDAQNVAWSITVKGGILGLVNRSAIGSQEMLIAHNTLSISVPPFIGFGKISIHISAQATNAVEITETKSAFLLGPFLIGIK